MPVRYLPLTPTVARNLGDLEELGLLPYRPSPIGALFTGLARALLPWAQAREMRRLEEEERRKERAERLARLLPLYPTGTPEFEQAFREYQQLEGLPTIPPPPQRPEEQLAIAANRLGILSQMAKLPPEFYPVARELAKGAGLNLPETPPTDPNTQFQFVTEFFKLVKDMPPSFRPLATRMVRDIAQRHNINIPEEFLTMTETPEEQRERELIETEIRLKKLQTQTIEEQRKPLREVLSEPARNFIASRYPQLLDLPLYMAEPAIGGLVKDIVAGDLQPARDVLSESAINWLKENLKFTDEQINRLTVADIKNRFPHLLLGTGTIAEMFGDEWANIVRQLPYLAPFGKMWATPDLVAQVVGAAMDFSMKSLDVTRAYLLNVQKQLDDAVTKGASPEWVGHLIGIYNGLAPTVDLAPITEQQARAMIERAANMLKLTEMEKQMRIQQALTNIEATRQRVQISAFNAAETARHHRVLEGLRAQGLALSAQGLALRTQEAERRARESYARDVKWATDRARQDWEKIPLDQPFTVIVDGKPVTFKRRLRAVRSGVEEQFVLLDPKGAEISVVPPHLAEHIRSAFIEQRAQQYLRALTPQQEDKPKESPKPQPKTTQPKVKIRRL